MDCMLVTSQVVHRLNQGSVGYNDLANGAHVARCLRPNPYASGAELLFARFRQKVAYVHCDAEHGGNSRKPPSPLSP